MPSLTEVRRIEKRIHKLIDEGKIDAENFDYLAAGLSPGGKRWLLDSLKKKLRKLQ